MYAFGEQKNLN